MKKIVIKILGTLSIVALMFSCQDLERPELESYPQDEANIPDGDLRFFVPFDKEGTELRYNFAEELSGYPSFLPDNSISQEDGINNKGYKGSASAYLRYLNPNDFASKSQSFSISFWMKHAPTTTNGEFVFSIPSSIGHWTGSTMNLFMESTPNGIAVKLILVDANNADTWMTWEGAGGALPPSTIMDDNWHHCAFVYDHNTSILTFYKDNTVIGTKTWANHGAINMDASKVNGFRLGGPSGTDSWMKPWNGNLDQFRLYAAALSPSQVSDLYNNQE